MLTINPTEIATKDLHQFMLASVAPRPIAFVSTMDNDGIANLAPYSFFNAFSSNPPILVFSSNRRVEGNTTKDTLHNIEQNRECVINVVSHNIVRQMAVASVEFAPAVDEFQKAGFTPLASELVRPFRVKESPVQMECKVESILPLGKEGGAGHLIVCHVVRMHIAEAVLDEKQQRIDPHKIDLVGRMGRFYYSRASGDAVFELVQPVLPVCIGFDQLPEALRHSAILTGNNLGQLAALLAVPTEESVRAWAAQDTHSQQLIQSGSNLGTALQTYAKTLLDKNDVENGAKAAFLSTYYQ